MKVSFSAPQTQALVSLLCTVGTFSTLDLRVENSALLERGGGLRARALHVTVWRNGEPTTWTIALDGETHEAA